MRSILHNTGPIVHQQMVLTALVPTEIKLVDGLKILSCIFIEF